MRRLRSNDPNVQCAAAWKLGRLGATVASGPLIKILRAAIAQEIPSRNFQPALAFRLDAVIGALGKLRSTEAIEHLSRLALQDGYRHSCLCALVEIGAPSVDPLVEMWKEYSWLRGNIGSALSRIQHIDAVHALRLLSHVPKSDISVWENRAKTVPWLAKQGNPLAIEELMELIGRECRSAVRDALAQIKERDWEQCAANATDHVLQSVARVQDVPGNMVRWPATRENPGGAEWQSGVDLSLLRKAAARELDRRQG